MFKKKSEMIEPCEKGRVMTGGRRRRRGICTNQGFTGLLLKNEEEREDDNEVDLCM